MEFLGLLPLLVMVCLVVWQGIVVLQRQAEAEADARTFARSAVVCGVRQPPDLHAIDPGADGGWFSVDTGHPPYVTAHVSLAAPSIVPGVTLTALGIANPAASVTMRHEPC